MRKGSLHMSTSKLTQYINITKLLMDCGPQTINQISSLLRNRNQVVLKQDLDFLSDSKILTEEPIGANLSYAITERGVGVLTFFEVKTSRATIKLKR
jgi:hypothetical protein